MVVPLAIRHVNSYGYVEYLDRLPVRDCACNKCERARKQERRSKKSGKVARGIAAAGIAGTVWGATTSPAQADTTTQKQYGESSLRREGRDRGDQAADATRDKGARDRSSSRRDRKL